MRDSWFWERGWYDNIDDLMARLNRGPQFKDWKVLYHIENGGYMAAFQIRRTA